MRPIRKYPYLLSVAIFSSLNPQLHRHTYIPRYLLRQHTHLAPSGKAIRYPICTASRTLPALNQSQFPTTNATQHNYTTMNSRLKKPLPPRGHHLPGPRQPNPATKPRNPQRQSTPPTSDTNPKASSQDDPRLRRRATQ